MKFQDLPSLGAPLGEGTFRGLTTNREGTHCAVVLLAEHEATRYTWAQYMDRAKKLGALPLTRAIAAMLMQVAPDQFDPDLYWMGEEVGFDASYAWYQDFHRGTQYYDRKCSKGRARFVRLIQLTP